MSTPSSLRIDPSSVTVFLSHSRLDRKFAKKLTRALEEHGISVVNHLSEANSIVALLSTHSSKSKWLSTEVEEALASDLIVIPLLLDLEAKNNLVWPLVGDRLALEVLNEKNKDLDQVVLEISSVLKGETIPAPHFLYRDQRPISSARVPLTTMQLEKDSTLIKSTTSSKTSIRNSLSGNNAMQHIDSIVDLIQDTESRFKDRASTREKARRSFESKDFAGANEDRAIQARLKRLGVTDEVNKKLRSESFEIPGRTRGEDARATIENVVLERILGENDLMPIAYLMEGQNRAKTVGRVLVKDRMGRLTSYGTGFMVSPNLLMTNNHVLETDGQAANSEIQFDYELDVNNREVTTSSFQFDPSTFFLTNEKLDFSLVAVSPNGDTKPSDWGWNNIPESDDGLIVKGEYVSIIQHPNGEMKQIALRENQILDFFDEFLHYKTDTAPGSSGSPVFNDQWDIVALHHSGVPERDQSGNIIAVDGRIWKKWMGDHRIKWIANEGIAIGRIVQFIKSASGLSDSQRKVRDEMFSESAPAVGDLAPPSLTSPRREVDSKNQPPKLLQNTDPATSMNGSSTWTIPIQITVDLGQPQQQQQTGSYTADVVAQPMASTSSTSVQPTDDADLRKALADFENAANREYYDEDQDEEDREEYYSGIDASSFSKKKMYEELNSLLKSTHSDKPRYKPRVHVYPWVDLHPDLKLRSIYSGKTFSAEEVIREDIRIEQERMQMLQELSLRENNMSHEAFEEAVSLLESQNPFNCEHVVPQSWFGKKEPEKGDLHHLFTCESGCNSFRSNIAYFDFADFEEALRTDCGKREDNKFEPNAGKGAVARATLYFLLRYKGKIESPDEFPKDRISILLQWHSDHPVDEYERHRNQAIFEMQGNRNPLIDFPEWAGKIKFDLGIG